MKKWMVIISIISLVALLGACGNNDNEKDQEDKSTTDSTTKKAKSSSNESNKAAETKENDTNDKAATTDKGSSNPTKEEKDTSTTTDTPKSPAKTEAFSFSPSGFKVSTVESILGGDVTTTYLSSSKSFQKDFEALTLFINQYKVEHVINPTKEVSASNPESYLANKNGYVITLDISIKNNSKKDKMYKADQISLLGASKSVGGSLDNFIPSGFHLIGSSSDPYNFTAGKTARGLLTFTMDEATYNDLAKDSQIGVPDPSRFDSSSTKGSSQDNVVAPFPIK
ncbi:TPA_asm: DUF5068 domain-containing protein [Listeria monocytogenes]|uniref:DUF5068 domain-containing protein n=1 Tax=Listeria monocytogenes TaxID=1639 RepID=A0A6Y7VSU5_LISMN|nr:DUF5068 domain-containing protein [Listeria monocytogenes]EAC3827790.1 DUF5068 domain-containing protein [Listeria monocytogenes]EAC8183986.1 DUF5068 domain-containing protein [Listeria monocytogenes]EAC8265677.1 DUF5068 domain-containing protein [Listeria monocytogenes]EAD3614798.1 DUF5068 domain-containing protein [Listeria monocytogenes]EAD3633983.1 DUF5068 domain-containing protein [Listeria monocytogenes]